MVYALADALPGADWVAFIVGFLLVLVVMGLIGILSKESWILMALSLVPGLMTLMPALDLPPERELARRGVPVEVIVASYEVPGIRDSTHRYVLVRSDGTRVGELVYRGRGGYGLEQGDRTTVLVDPAGRVPLELESEVDPDRTARTLRVGCGGLLLLIASAALVGRRRERLGLPRRDTDTTEPSR